MDELKIIITYKASKNNRKLLEFVKRNLSKTVGNNIKYHFTVAFNEDREYYSKKGIRTFPCVIYQSKKVSGTDRVVAFIQDLVRQRVEEQENQPVGELLDDYFKESLGDKRSMEQEGDETSANPDDMGRDHMAQVQNELERRNLKTEHLKNYREGGETAPKNLPPSKRKALAKKHAPQQSQRKNNVDADPPVGDAMKNLKPSSQQEAADDALMLQFFENQMATD